MIVNLIIFWLLMTFCFGSRFAGKAVRSIFGILAIFWAIGILIKFGMLILPLILVAVVFSKMVIPFVGTFLRHFQ